MDRWCETEMVWTGRTNVRVATGCRDAEGLRNALTSTCMVSVPREDVLDLPPRTTAVRALVLNGQATKYRRIEKEFLNWIREVKGDDAYRRAAKAEAITKLMALWEQDGLAKVKATVEYVTSLVDQDEQVVLFAHHKSVALALYEALIDANVVVADIIGGMSSEAKADVVTDFQAGEIDVIIGNIEAAGTGLTLTASRHVVFAQLPWSPGSYGQACDRIYRISQERHCTTHVLNMQEGVSEHLWAVLADKAATADAVNTGTPSTIDASSVEEAVLESYGW
jgi:SWI/SNF-related matrix-associated actin-dependent regulator 1 of chromatin subfamily A